MYVKIYIETSFVENKDRETNFRFDVDSFGDKWKETLAPGTYSR